MVNILGINILVTGKILYTKSSPIVLDYINAIKLGKNQAEKILEKSLVK